MYIHTFIHNKLNGDERWKMILGNPGKREDRPGGLSVAETKENLYP